MATLIVPGVCRFTVHGTYGGSQIANILDMRIDTTGSTQSRPDAIEDQAGIIINQWLGDVMDQVCNEYTFTSVSWVDLNSSTGSVGERTSTGTVTLPQLGAINGQGLPGNASMLITKLAPANRGERNGRLYLVGITEANTTQADPTDFPNATLAQVNTSFAAFKGNCEQEDFNPTGHQSNFVVVHITARDGDGHPTAGVGSDLQAFAAQSRMATQRRRARR